MVNQGIIEIERIEKESKIKYTFNSEKTEMITLFVSLFDRFRQFFKNILLIDLTDLYQFLNCKIIEQSTHYYKHLNF